MPQTFGMVDEPETKCAWPNLRPGTSNSMGWFQLRQPGGLFIARVYRIVLPVRCARLRSMALRPRLSAGLLVSVSMLGRFDWRHVIMALATPVYGQSSGIFPSNIIWNAGVKVFATLAPHCVRCSAGGHPCGTRLWIAEPLSNSLSLLSPSPQSF